MEEKGEVVVVVGGAKSIRSSETLWIYRWKEGIRRDIESVEGASIPGLQLQARTHREANR